MGSLVVILGIGLLLSQMGVIAGDKIVRLWPLLMIWAGFNRIIEVRGNPRRALWGVFVIVMGSMFLLDQFDIYHFQIRHMWPVFVIVGGLIMVLQSLGPRNEPAGRIRGSWFDYCQDSLRVDPNSDLNAIAVFGGVQRNVTSQKFRGGRLTAIIGGIEIDFSGAEIDGAEAILEVTAFLGGIEIRVPDSWNVTFEAVAILAGSSDERRRTPIPAAGVTPKHLIIRGAAVLAGVEVKN